MSDGELVWIAVGSIAAASGSLITAGGLFFANRQLRESKKISRGEFILRLDDVFRQHIETHMRLRPGGDWSDRITGPRMIQNGVA